jgi:hypothetical protein
MRHIFWLILAGEFPGKFPIHTEMNAAHAVGTGPRLSHFPRQGLARFVKSPERTVHVTARPHNLRVPASLLRFMGLLKPSPPAAEAWVEVRRNVFQVWRGGRGSLRRIRETVRSEISMPSILSSP